MKKYLIIGGAGFIGSHLSKALRVQGNEVAVLDKRTGGDAGDGASVEAVFEKEKPDVVFHLAGPINLRRPAEDPLFTKDKDFLKRAQNILDACRRYDVQKIIFVSSGGAIYENALQMPTSEDYAAHPKSPYGLANLAIEEYIKKSGMPFAIARLSNVYGPGQWESGFIPATIIKILQGKQPVISGTGSQTRDFIYIEDVAQALMLLAKKGENETYNVGSGRETSLNEIFALIKSIMGSETAPVYESMENPGTERSAVDMGKIQKELDWRPVVNMKEGLQKTIEYYKHAK